MEDLYEKVDYLEGVIDTLKQKIESIEKELKDLQEQAVKKFFDIPDRKSINDELNKIIG